MIKALFFDIDGTLVSFRTHAIPQSTVDALTKAKARGIEIYIATGRPYSIINNIGAIEHLVDGYICTNGADCFIGEKTISLSPLPAEDVAVVLDSAVEMGFACLAAGRDEMMMFNTNAEAEHIFKDLLDIDNYRISDNADDICGQDILQLTPFIDTATEKNLMQLLRGCESSRWYPAFADITARGVNKAKGIRAIAAYRGFDISETMAFGDGGNDCSMVVASGTGVAMGNANEALKAVADYITSSVDDDGVATALLHFGVI